MIALTPKPPYYAVIFTSLMNKETAGYQAMALKMIELAQKQAGFLGMESIKDSDGFGITVSYWVSLESISSWKGDIQHQIAQNYGKKKWYANYKVRITKVERDY